MTLTKSEKIDIELLVAPLTGASHGGDNRVYVRELRSLFSELRNPSISTNPDAPDGDGVRQEPDWQAICELAVETLETKAKDLRVACHLAEALMHLRGLAGLGEGLSVIAGLLESGWDYLLPPIDPEDPEVRTSPIDNLLDDPSRGPCLPLALKSLPIINLGAHQVSLQDATRRAATEDEKNRVNLAISNCSKEQGRTYLSEFQEAKTQLNRIKAALNERLGVSAPGLANLTESLDLVGKWLSSCFGSKTEPEITSAEESPTQTPAVPVSSTGDLVQPENDPVDVMRLSIQMRNEAYKKLTDAATILQQIEPHSPIPYMIHRAVRLGKMPFPDLVGKLVREDSILQSIRGEFGLGVDDET